MTDAFLIEALSTTMRATNLNKFIEGSAVNLCRNGSFEYWDATPEPFGWDFDDGGADTVASSTNLNYVYDGAKCAQVTKDTTGTAQLKRSIEEIAAVYAKSKYWAARAVVKGDYGASAVRLWISFDGGSTKTYSSYAAGGASHNELTVRALCGAAPSNKPMVGIEMLSGSYDCYIDTVGFYLGEIAWPWTECPWDPSGNITDELDPIQPHVWVWDPHGADIFAITNSGTTSFTAKDIVSATSSWCRDNCQAVLMNVAITDDNGLDAKIEFCEKGDSADATKVFYRHPLVAAVPHMFQVQVGLDSGGEIEYKITSHNGTDGFDLTAYPMAYLRPI